MIRVLAALIVAVGLLSAPVVAADRVQAMHHAFGSAVRVQANVTDLQYPDLPPQLDEPMCSGFVAYSDRGFTVIVTARHCTEGDFTSNLVPTSVLFADGDVAQVDRVVRDSQDDLAVLIVSARHNHPSLYLHSGVERGDDLFAIGMPNGFAWSYAPATSMTGSMPAGMLNDELPPGVESANIIECSGCGQGLSGGPILNAAGKVVGVLIESLVDTSTYLMIPADHVSRFLLRLPPLR